MKNAAMTLFALFLFSGTATLAYADCVSNGKSYPTGTVIDGFICAPGGKWVKV